MNSIRETLALYEELISCSHNLYFWTYTPEFELLHTSCPTQCRESDSIFLINQSEALLHYAKEGHYPFVLDSFLNILWIADFEWEQGTLQKIHIIGPALTGKNSYQKLKNKLDARNFSVPAKLAVLKQLDSIPILPSNLLFQYAIMLHYCITGEKISSQDLQYPRLQETQDMIQNIQTISDEHRGIWAAEQVLINAFRTGNPDYKDALEKSSSLSSGVKFDVGDSLRKAKNNLLVLLTLCSRAAIEGGLSPSVSYTLCDQYTQRSEDAESFSEITMLCHTMLADFMERLSLSLENSAISQPVKSCCSYISMHIKEKLSMDDLAERAGYTEYYFSRKFSQEMGITINEYIRQEKVRHAKLLLSTTNMDLQEISEELSFSSRSYFSDTFQKVTGEAPGEYRKKHLKM